MQHRGLRLGLLCLLIASAGLAAFVAWSAERHLVQLDQNRQAREATVDRLLVTLASIGAALETQVDSGRQDVSLVQRMSALIDRITTDAAGLRATPDTPSSTSHLEEFWTALSALMGADARARESLAAADEIAVIDTLLASSRLHVASLDSSLRAFRAAEEEAYSNSRGQVANQSRMALLAAAVLWLLGLILFALVPLRITEIRTVAAAATEMPPPSVPDRTDLADAARLASDLARLPDPSRLSDALGRACTAMRARGAIVWLERGEELVAAAAFGYDTAVLHRLRPIPRSADNATAAAWREGEVQIVAADGEGHGAIVAPLPTPSGTVGAFAIEVPAGTERDGGLASTATIVAAQLATVIALWSAAQPTDATGPELDRQAAAS